MSCGDLYETVRSAFAKNDTKGLSDLYARMQVEVDVRSLRSVQELLDDIYSTDHALSRNFGAESYVPKSAREGKGKACTAIR